jgi:CoA-transferase family III
LPPDVAAPIFPLSGWANGQLQQLAQETGSPQIAGLTGAGLLGERAALNGFSVPELVAAGGGCRLYQAADGRIALSLVRPDDRMLLPALLRDATFDPSDNAGLVKRLRLAKAQDLVDQGTQLGLAIAGVDEGSTGPASEIVCRGTEGRVSNLNRHPELDSGSRGARSTIRTGNSWMLNQRPAGSQHDGDRDVHPPLVIDLSALWAGPLATHLLQLAGATVIKVESILRPDAMRGGDPDFFNLLNQNKASVALDLSAESGRSALLALIHKADIVVEASRPRALVQLGIDADTLVRDQPGLVWISITGHGMCGDAANRIGFGDDCGVAGGLTAALHTASGVMGFVGDAIADPLTGIAAARLAWSQWLGGVGGRIALSMSGVVRAACAAEEGLDLQLQQWAASAGQPFPCVPSRSRSAARAFGADTDQWHTC